MARVVKWAARRAALGVYSSYFRTLRLPLSTDTAGWGYINLYREFGGDGLLMDINYLSNLFQKELALAAERIFTQVSAEEVAHAGAAGAK